nr:hypothetical protein [Tanacetum cinerariifolium]
SIRILKKPIRIKLPDGTSKWVDKVGKLLKTQSLIAIFLPTMFLFQDPSTKKVLAVGEEFQSKHVASDLFHARLGHTSVSKLVHVGDCNQKDIARLSCNTCLLVIQHRLPFSLSHTKSLVAFELIHVDVWGPYKVPALNGAHYFFTIVDDFSRCTWTYLLHTKDQVLSMLCNFMAYIANHFNAKPKFLRSDNETEIINGDCLAYLRKQGIVHQKSMVYTPQQNTIVERKHRSIKSVLIGYPPGQKGYKIYNLETREVFCSRDVSFQENIFPFKKDYVFYESSLNKHQWHIEDVVEDEDFVPCSVPGVSPENDEPNTPSENDMPNISSETVMPNTPSDGSNSSIPNEMPSTRRSTRTTTQPVWLKDFVTSKHKVSSVLSNNDKQHVYPLFQEADFHNYPNDYVASLAHVLATSEPNSYSQAANDPKWVKAMEKKLKALEINDTWQRKYVLDLLKDTGLIAAKPTPFPLPQNMKLSLDKGASISDPESYKRLVGRLLYLSMTRPDIFYAVQHLTNPCYHERTKHLDIDCHFTRDKIQEGILQTAYIPTHLQLVDIMTKALGGAQHSFLADKLGFQDVPT